MTESTVAWRCIILQLSGKLKTGEARNIAFAYDLPDRFRKNDVPGEDILEQLEMNGTFSSASPDGLVDVFVNLERKDLAKQAKEKIKEFQAKQWRVNPSRSRCQCGRLEVACRSALCHVAMAEEQLSKVVTTQCFEQDVTLKRQINGANQMIIKLKATLQKIISDKIVGEDATYETPSEPISPKSTSPVYHNRPLPPVHPTTPQPFKELNISPYARLSYYSKHPIPATCTDGTSTGNNAPTIFPHPQEEEGQTSVKAREDEEEEEEPVYESVELLLSNRKTIAQGLFTRTSLSRKPVKRMMSKSNCSIDLLQMEDEEEGGTEKDESSDDFAASEGYVTLKAITDGLNPND